jgi:hypothetical protein
MALRIMIVDKDAFRCGYVASGLVPLGATIVGPIADASEACSVLENGPIPDAVIIAEHLADGPAEALLSMVRQSGIPHLVLIDEGVLEAELATTPVLRRPVASFQVVDWVIRTIEKS